MSRDLFGALRAGTERIAVWADLLDNINVYPVADGDTGRNLTISLMPLKSPAADRSVLIEKLFLAARGNSGNIASQFFTGLLSCDTEQQLADAVQTGTQRAWQALADPRPGTMLSLFSELESALRELPRDDAGAWIPPLIKRLEAAVARTATELTQLRDAHVVDAGALGMFIFFDAFFNELFLERPMFAPIHELFRDYLTVHPAESGTAEPGSCVDAVVELNARSPVSLNDLSMIGESIVSREYEGRLKIHIHTRDQSTLRSMLARGGTILQWSSDDLEAQTKSFFRGPASGTIHIMTDAAGSMTREDAHTLGITLLDSYITIGTKDYPETRVDSHELYEAMSGGIKVTTSQASVSERSQHYEKVLGLYGTALYLCVGSVFTGNYRTVMDWKKSHDPEDRLKVIDSGSASGRLGLAALATAEFSRTASDGAAVVDFAARAAAACEEYIFLDSLSYLAAGGRMSKTGAVFGDMLHLKPVVSPLPEGAKKVGMVRNRKDQIAFAMKKLDTSVLSSDHPLVMLEYTDNQAWVAGEIAPLVKTRLPDAKIIIHPLSLTTGVHTGPGTWGIAFLPVNPNNAFAK